MWLWTHMAPAWPHPCCCATGEQDIRVCAVLLTAWFWLYSELFVCAVWCLCDLMCYMQYERSLRGEAGSSASFWSTEWEKRPCGTPAGRAVFMCFCWMLRMDHHTWALVQGMQYFQHLKCFLSSSSDLTLPVSLSMSQCQPPVCMWRFTTSLLMLHNSPESCQCDGLIWSSKGWNHGTYFPHGTARVLLQTPHICLGMPCLCNMGLGSGLSWSSLVLGVELENYMVKRISAETITSSDHKKLYTERCCLCPPQPNPKASPQTTEALSFSSLFSAEYSEVYSDNFTWN